MFDDRLVPVPTTVSRMLRTTVANRGAMEAYVGPDDRPRWKDIEFQTRRIAKALHAAGIRHGDHVGIMMGNDSTWICAFFACASLGAVTVPISTRFKVEELLFCLKQADVKLLMHAHSFLSISFTDLLLQVEPALGRSLPGSALPLLEAVVARGGEGTLPGGVSGWDDFLAAGDSVADQVLTSLSDAVRPDDILLMQFTSGTTSFPKGVMLTHANMLGDAASVARRMGVNAEDRYFSIRPFFHVAGSTLSILVSLCSGCCLLSLPRFDVAVALDVLDNERCTLTSGNDTIFLMLMGHPAFNSDRIHLVGGWAAAGPEVMQKIYDVMKVPHICNAYGQSEASPNVLISDAIDEFELRKEGFMLPHPGVDVRLADAESGVVIEAGQGQGEIQVRGWNVMRGYYKMPEATAKAFTEDGWLRTGDLGEQRSDGRMRMVGRLKDMYRVGGENVAPAEVEEVLHAHRAVKQAQVIGVPDARLGEVTGAFVLVKDGFDVTEGELVAWCKARCANFKVPRYIALVDSFEHIGMTGSSKVQKNKLREHAMALWNIGKDTVAS